MEPIDAAHERMSDFLSEFATYSNTLFTEQDTRVKVLDRLFIEVLGWPYSDVRTESRAGMGFIDYQFIRENRTRLIVEAKRDGLEFGLKGRTAGRAYKLNGPTFGNPSARGGIEQAIQYCAHKNSELAVVSNGREFIVFRGSRLGDGKDTLDGVAFIFPSIESVAENFGHFFDLLAPSSVERFEFRAHFQEAEGRPIRSTLFERALRPPSTRKLAPHEELSADLDRLMTSFFRRLAGDDDPEMLSKCFVATDQSGHADQTLARVSEDMVHRVQGLDTSSGDELARILESAHVRQGREFVILVGTKGAGKTTFIDRFFRQVLPYKIKKNCVVARINVGESKGDEAHIADWLDHKLLDGLEHALFGDAPPSFDEIQGMFFDEYQRRSEGTLKHLYESDKHAFKIDFGRHVEKRRESRPHEYIERLLLHIVRSRKKVPCLVLDNADHFTIEFQEKVFQFARSLYEKAMCLVILPVTDRTTWHLSRDGALRSFEFEALYLPTPSPREILKRRIEFLRQKSSEGDSGEQGHYFVGKGIRLSISNIHTFADALQGVFVNTGKTSQCVGYLANHDIRRCLEITRQVVVSPHLGATELLKAQVTGTASTIPEWKITKALLRGRYDIYPEGEHEFVFNVFYMVDDSEASPLMAVRTLQLLRDARGPKAEDPYVSVEQLVAYFSAMQVDPRVTLAWLSKLLESGMVQNYDPTVREVRAAGRVQLTPAGFQHLRWSLKNPDYINAMREVTPLRSLDVYNELADLRAQGRQDTWRRELQGFIGYLIAEDAQWVRVPEHPSYVSQRKVTPQLEAAPDNA